MSDDGFEALGNPRPMAGEWARQEAYVQGIADTLFVLALFDLIDTRSPCMRCGEQTDDTVNALGVDFPMCEGCQ